MKLWQSESAHGAMKHGWDITQCVIHIIIV